MNTITLEKRPVREYAIEEAKKYEYEKNLQKTSTHIFLKKESEYTSVKRIINKFADKSTMEFDTIFKLYKLQNYQFTPQLFMGTSYIYGTLASFNNYVKIATRNGKLKSNNPALSTFNTISEFVNAIKSFSEPFTYPFSLDESKKKATALLDLENLTSEERDFILSKISSRKPAVSDELRNKPKTKYKNKKKEQKEMKKLEKETSKKSSRDLLTADDFSIIVNNYKLGTKVVRTLLPKRNDKTLANYIRICKKLESGAKLPKTTPSLLVDVFNSRSNRTIEHGAQYSEKFVIMSGDCIIKTSSSEEFLRGYLEASANSNYKLYKLTEL